MAISGSTAIVGAWQEYPGGVADAGAAYIFVRSSDGNWSETQKLIASDRQTNDVFGESVAISGNTAIIGAPHEDQDGGLNAGAAYIFVRSSDGTWPEHEAQKTLFRHMFRLKFQAKFGIRKLGPPRPQGIRKLHET